MVEKSGVKGQKSSMEEGEVEFRKEFLELTKKDEEVLKKIGEVLDKHVDEIIDAFYEHLLKFEESRAFFPDKETIKRLKSFQKTYFKRLTEGDYNKDYFENRLRVGEAHDGVKLPPKLYMGGYNKYFQIVIPRICKELGYKDCDAALPIASFIKIMFLDMILAMDAYITSREKVLKKRLGELETFYKATVGRELKMVELKKRIKELEKQLNKRK